MKFAYGFANKFANLAWKADEVFYQQNAINHCTAPALFNSSPNILTIPVTT